MHSTTVVGYTFNADTLCLDCTFDEFVLEAVAAVGTLAYHYDTHEVLLAVALKRSIDMNDEHSYDSGDFPKVIFADSVQVAEACGSCGEQLIPDY